MTVHRPPTDRPSVCTTGKPMFTLTHLPSLGAQEKTNCTSMLWSIDSYQNRASADQYHLTVPQAQVSTHRGWVFFGSYPLTNYQSQMIMIAGSSLFFFQGFISNMLCLCHYGPALLGFWFQTDLGSENSASFFKSTGGEDLILPWSRVGHALRPIFILWLVKIDRWVHVEKLYSINKGDFCLIG